MGRAQVTFEAIVQDYISHYRDRGRREMCYYLHQPSLEDAIRAAALSCLPNGKRHPHQRRIPGQVLQKAERRLQAIAEQLRAANSFVELYRRIEHRLGTVRGIGDLAIYDIAHRIGAFLGLEPDAVYLHAGTREGARALNLSGKAIDVSVLPVELQKLSAAEAEDCLCIYKDLLRDRDRRYARKNPRGCGLNRATCG